MAYNAIFEKVPQPETGFLTVSNEPGLGLNPKDGLIQEYEAKPESLGGVMTRRGLPRPATAPVIVHEILGPILKSA